MEIDLNADVGESDGSGTPGEDEELIPLCSSVNVACGFHAGNPVTMARSVRLAASAGVAVGAHPGYPDLAGFGRRDLEIPLDELRALVLYQVGALQAVARAEGIEVRHVKPHGALYNRAARDPAVAEAVAGAVRLASADLLLVGLVGSHLVSAGMAAGLRVAGEAFLDRAYDDDGSLRSRSEPDAVIDDPRMVASRALDLAIRGRVTSVGGKTLRLSAQTLCVHGERPGAADRARAARRALEASGIRLAPPAP